jgi:hypothetical protein
MANRWSEAASDAHTLRLFDSVMYEMGISKPVGLYVCSCVSTPMLVGLARPRILLSALDFDDDELSYILRHELVHFKRRDLYYKCLTLAVSTLHWFNPIIYLAARAIDSLCEISCDAEVVKGMDGCRRLRYTETIINVVRYKSRFKTALSTNFYGGMKSMKQRITSIMDISKKRGGIIIACFVLILTVGTGAVFAANGPASSGVPSKAPEGGTVNLVRAMMKTDLKSATASGFNERIEEICQEGGTGVLEVIFEIKGIFNGKSAGEDELYDEEIKRFVETTLDYSGTEIYAERHKEKAAHLGSVMRREADDIYPVVSYYIEAERTDIGMTVAERDDRINAAHAAIKDYVRGLSTAEAQSDTLEENMRAELNKLAEAQCDGKMSIAYKIQSVERESDWASPASAETTYDYTYTQKGFYQEPYVFFLGWNADDANHDIFDESYDVQAEIEVSDSVTATVYFDGSLAEDADNPDVLDALTKLVRKLKPLYQYTSTPLTAMLVSGIHNLSGKNIEDTAEEFYGGGELVYFSAIFEELEDDVKEAYAERMFEDGNVSFFGACRDSMSKELLAYIVERAYKEGNTAFFSIAIGQLTVKELEEWMSDNLVSKNSPFAHIINNRIGDILDAAHEDETYAAYEKFGLIMNRRTEKLYYNGEPVRVFEDSYPVDIDAIGIRIAGVNDYFDTEGTVDVRAIRDFSKIKLNPDGSHDPSGELIGLESLSKAEFKARDIEEYRNPQVTSAVSAPVYDGAYESGSNASYGAFAAPTTNAVDASSGSLTPDELAERYSIYEPFGVTYDADFDRFYYGGKTVRRFLDVFIGNGESFSSGKFKGAMMSLYNEDGEIDITAVRDYSILDKDGYGKLTGIEVSGD